MTNAELIKVLQASSSDLTATDPQAIRSATIYVVLGVLVCLVTVAAVVFVSLKQPSNASIISTIIGITTPITLALLGYGLQNTLQGVHRLVDGNLSVVRAKLEAALVKIEEMHATALGVAERSQPQQLQPTLAAVEPVRVSLTAASDSAVVTTKTQS